MHWTRIGRGLGLLTLLALASIAVPPWAEIRSVLVSLADTLANPASDPVDPRGLHPASMAAREDATAPGTRAVRYAPGDRVIGTNQAEQESREAWQLAEQGRAIEAQGLVARVLHDRPDFRPALTLNGMLAGAWTLGARDADADAAADGASSSGPRAAPPPELLEETRLRLAAVGSGQLHAGMVPANLLQLSPAVQTVLVADMSEARLYVLRHAGDRLEALGDYYVSTGARGPHKQTPGDQRTPVGIYSLGSRLPGRLLPALAGHGAWPLAFPNRWDQWLGRRGSGIWLHGSPPGQSDGLPHSTNGCLALSNQDIDRLAPLLSRQGTLLLVSEQIEWITPEEVQHRRQAALDRLQHAGVTHGVAAHESVYAYPGEPDLLLVRVDEDHNHAEEQFWPHGALEPLREAQLY